MKAYFSCRYKGCALLFSLSVRNTYLSGNLSGNKTYSSITAKKVGISLGSQFALR